MKSILSTLIGVTALLLVNTAKAQWVPIPQSFADYIKLYVDSTAINGNLLDTTNATVTTLTEIYIYPYDNVVINDLSGLQYFDNLRHFSYLTDGQSNQDNTPIIFVPLLPANISTFEVTSSTLTSIQGPLPQLMTRLSLKRSCISSWPTLPSTLLVFDLSFGCYQSLPPLPNSLFALTLDSTDLTVLPNLSNTSLNSLSIDHTQISSLPSLPNTFRWLSAVGCPITSLANLPSKPTGLNISRTLVTTLPLLNDTMTILNFSYAPITSITNFPVSIVDFEMDSMVNFQSFPFHLSKVAQLSISYNPQLPVLNFINSIDSFYYSDTSAPAVSIIATHDGLTSMPNLTSTYFFEFDLSHNNIQHINDTVFGRVGDKIDLSYNQIDSLARSSYDSVNARLLTVNLSNNNISYIDWLPKFPPTYLSYTVIDLRNNRINCMPFFSDNCGFLELKGNPLTCLPDLPAHPVIDTSLAVCQNPNPNSCDNIGIIKGKVFEDSNLNGILDSNEVGVPNFKLVLTCADGSVKFATDSDGHYTSNVPLYQADTIQGDTAQVSYPQYTYTTPVVYSFINSPWQVDSGRNIGIVINHTPVYDVAVSIAATTRARNGKDYRYQVKIKNVGTVTQSGNVTLHFDQALRYIGSSTTPASVNSDSITWAFNNLLPFQSKTINVDFVLPAAVPIGTPLTATANVVSTTGDSNLLNNQQMYTDTVVGSFDPNEKIVKPSGPLTQEQVDTLVELNYTVFFQNTGTASALNIRVEDTLSPNLDLRTFKFLNSSHLASWQINNRILSVNFYNIDLPDSNSSERNSHGFFNYSIRPDSTFDTSMDISNTAYIYFDYNQPVATNTTHIGKHQFDGIAVLPTLEEGIMLFPNPTNALVSILVDASGLVEGDLYNALGQKLRHFSFDGTQAYTISVADLPKGLYVIKCKLPNHVYRTAKLLVK